MIEKRMLCENGIWSVGRRNRNEDSEMPVDDRTRFGRFGAAAGCDLAAGQGAEFEICDSGVGLWIKYAKS